MTRQGDTLTAEWRTILAEFEKQFTVTTGAGRAFDYLADPVRLPEYVSTVHLEASTAVEGELDVEADLADRSGAPAAGFVADRATCRIDWGRPERGYGGSIQITPGTTNTAGVVLRLRTRDDADPDAVTKIFDQTVANIRRVLSGR